ncbi:tRNA (guanosine(37)-N1)-methyltransferase TrmD [Candidatus Microgenomates bacterium]|nr:tRNA (guanosine(37)-N1)-methyltransferase TrmD [Candidatus Microgenomates bacterium]
MKIDIVTLFPKMFVGPFDESMLWKAKDKGLVEINIHDLRKWGEGERKTVDDKPYGGGPGMLLRVDIVDACLKDLKTSQSKIILMDAGGEKFSQQKALNLSQEKHLIILCGHYEGFDYRVHENLVDEIFSIGDFVLTGGELPAMMVTDAILRLVPGVLGAGEYATINESHTEVGIIEHPQYTRPDNYNGWEVPEILKTGNHPQIEKWRKEESSKRSKID